MTVNQKRIALATLLMSFLATIIEILPLISVPSWISKTYPVLYYFGNLVHVQFLNRTLGQIHGSSAIGNTNYIELFFYMLMFLGGILYIVSRQREVRLIRFAFAIIGASAVIGAFSSIMAFAVYFKEYMAQGASLSWMLYAFPKAGLLAFLSVWILKELEKSITLQTYLDAAGEVTLISTPKWQRFFHHIVDTILSVLICAPLLFPLIKFLEWVDDKMGERTALFTMVIICRFFYYVIFESVLAASAAKLLTGSRVVTFSGERPDVFKVISRSLCRNIPFEPFSNLTKSGWHDTISETDVVKEENSGVPASRYLWIIPITLVVGLGAYFGYDAYEDYKSLKARTDEYDAKVKGWMDEIDHLSNTHYIVLEDQKSSYPDTITCLKVDSVMGDKVKVSITFLEDRASQIRIAAAFDDLSGMGEEQIINLADLRSAITMDYQNDYYGDKSFNRILQGDAKYVVENIFVRDQPLFDDGGGSIREGEIHLGVKNCGWPVEIVEVKIIEGDLTWNDVLPMPFEGGRNETYDACTEKYLSFKTEGNPYADYVIELVVQNSKGDRLVFVVKGSGLTNTIERKIE